MKKIFIFVLAALFLAACSKDDLPLGTELPITGEAGFKVNGEVFAPSDTVYFLTKETATFELLIGGKKISPAWHFSEPQNETSLLGLTFNQQGKFKLTATVAEKNYFLNVFVADEYQLKVNDQSADLIQVAKGEELKFKVSSSLGGDIYSSFNLGDDRQIQGYQPKASYNDYGSYTVKAKFKNRQLSMVVKVVKVSEPAIILLESRVDNGFIYGTLGLKASVLPNWTPNKKTYVSGEIPGAYWKDYEITERETINETAYFKFKFSSLPGKFRLSWIQLKDGYTKFNYDDCNWAWDPTSPYWTTDYLFVFYIRIENGKAVIKNS